MVYVTITVVSIAIVLSVFGAIGARQLVRAARSPGTWAEIETRYHEAIDSDDGKTSEPAEHWFSLDSLYDELVVSRANLPAVFFLDHGRDISNSLVGIGIFGTFFGLMLGIGGFDVGSTDTIRFSVQSLLGGMSTAFITSIVGIGSSIIFLHVVYNPTMSRTEVAIAARCRRLDGKYFVPPHVRLLDQFRASHDQLQKQTEGISSFKDSIAAALAEVMEELNEKQFKPMNEQVERAVHELVDVAKEIKETAGNTGQEILKDVTGTLQEAIERLLSDFLGWFSEESKRELEQLLEGLTAAREALETVPREVAAAFDRVSDTVTTQTELFSETVERAQRQTEEVNDTLSKMGEVAQGIDASGNLLTSSLESANDVWRRMKESVDAQQQGTQETLKGIRETSESIGNSAETMAGVVESFESVQQEIERVFEAVDRNISAYADTVETSLDRYLKSYTQETTDMLQRLAQSFEGLKEEIEAIDSVDRERVDRASESLTGFQNDLSSFREVLDRQASAMSQVSELVSKHSEQLASGHTEMKEANERLLQQFDTVLEKLSDSERSPWWRR